MKNLKMIQLIMPGGNGTLHKGLKKQRQGFFGGLLGKILSRSITKPIRFLRNKSSGQSGLSGNVKGKTEKVWTKLATQAATGANPNRLWSGLIALNWKTKTVIKRKQSVKHLPIKHFKFIKAESKRKKTLPSAELQQMDFSVFNMPKKSFKAGASLKKKSALGFGHVRQEGPGVTIGTVLKGNTAPNQLKKAYVLKAVQQEPVTAWAPNESVKNHLPVKHAKIVSEAVSLPSAPKNASVKSFSEMFLAQGNEKYQKFLQHFYAQRQNLTAKAKTPLSRSGLQAFFAIREIGQKANDFPNSKTVRSVNLEQNIQLRFKKQGKQTLVTMQASDKSTLTRLKKQLKNIQKISGQKLPLTVKFEVNKHIREAEKIEKKPHTQIPKKFERRQNGRTLQNGGKSVRQSFPEELTLLPKATAIAKEKMRSGKKKTAKAQIEHPLPIGKNSGAAQRQKTEKIVVPKSPAKENTAQNRQPTHQKQTATTKLKVKPASPTVSLQPETIHPAGNVISAQHKSALLTSKLSEIIQKYDWTKNRLGLKTSFKIENGPVGRMEIRFTEKRHTHSIHVLVESESAKTEVQKILPQVQHNLIQKGMHLNTINVTVTNFATTPEQFREHQKHKSKLTHSSKDYEEVRDEQHESTLKKRNFGYNTIEVIA